MKHSLQNLLRNRLATVLLLLSAINGSGYASELADAPLAMLSMEGHFAMMRHALAPGTGDPAEFDVNDCSTQRNLDAEGREQARKTGEFLRSGNFQSLAVYSSQWCRCLETAELLELASVKTLPLLNSFFQNRAVADEQTRELDSWLQKWRQERRHDKPLLLVTHQVNITALTGVYPASGEIIIAKRLANGDIEVAGRITPR